MSGWNGSVPDTLGTTFFNSQANFNFAAPVSPRQDTEFSGTPIRPMPTPLCHPSNGRRPLQTIYKDWSVKLHADGQWANGALISNEQYAMGGTAGVRGYQDGQAYGDTGWRFSIEPQTPPHEHRHGRQ